MSLFAKHKKHTIFDLAFTVLLALFFLAGLFTAGSFQNTGKDVQCRSDDDHSAVFEVQASSGEKVKSVWLNVGAIYTEIGTDLTVTIYRAATKSVTTAPSLIFGKITLGNVYSAKGTGKSGALYNWVQIEAEEVKTVALLRVEADADFVLGEIVATDENGEIVPLQVNAKFSEGYASPLKKLAPAVDSQKRFNFSNALKYNFTQEEAYTLLSVQNLLLGNTYTEDCVYSLDGRWNVLSAILYLPSVALFGTSTMALRLPSLIATTLALFFVYAFSKALFKDEKSAFVVALFCMIGGLALTSGILGATYSFVFSALTGSAYFMYRFFSRGVSSEKPIRDSLNVLFSGLFSAVALSIDILSVFPVSAILVLFYFGQRRQKAAYTVALAKTDDELKRAKETSVYAYKTKVTYGFALLSFVIGSFAFLLLSSVASYGALVRTYDDPVSPSLGVLTLLFKSMSVSVNKTEYTLANASSAFLWFLPMKAATLYNGIDAPALGRYLGGNAVMNPVLSLLSLLAFAYSTFALVKGFNAEEQTKELKRERRIYFVLLAIVLSSLLSGLFLKNASAAETLLFTTGYFAFIPLGAKQLAGGRGFKQSHEKAANAVLCAVSVCAIVVFALSIPSVFGFEISSNLAKKLFGYTAFSGNGFFPS